MTSPSENEQLGNEVWKSKSAVKLDAIEWVGTCSVTALDESHFCGERKTPPFLSPKKMAGEALDQPAVDLVMGHTPHSNDMAARYRQRIADERLENVAEHVRMWLFANRVRAVEKKSKRTAKA